MPSSERAVCNHQSMQPDCAVCRLWIEDTGLDDLRPFEAAPGPLTTAPDHMAPCSRCQTSTRFRDSEGTAVCSAHRG